ncbi:MAG TPA: tetratricopeptide repeat protein [Deltaproteobacteria bacterium]|nr:tetratricopeptide repeat protein [Deltaproteobacteria bacterium]
MFVDTPISPEKRYAMAATAFDAGDVSSVIRSLEEAHGGLSPQEMVLLARAFWARSYPYRMDTLATEALHLMNQALSVMPTEADKEQLMFEYSTMLLHAGLISEAQNLLRVLKESLHPDMVIKAHIQEIDVLNHRGSFQDAFVANRRMLAIKGDDEMPEDMSGRYLSILADTYLGLNAHQKALDLYHEAVTTDSSLLRNDPDLFSRMGKAAFGLGAYATAREHLLSAINQGNPDSRQDALLMLGDSLSHLDEKDKAMTVFSEVETLAPHSESGIIAKLRTAKILLEKDLAMHGSLTDSTFYEIMDIYEALKTTREYSEGQLGSIIRVRIAQTYAHRGDWEESLQAYYRVWFETTPEDPIHRYAQTEAVETLQTRVAELYTAGKYDQVCELHNAYQDSFIREITCSETLFRLGHSLYEMGQGYQARPLLILSTEHDVSAKDQALALLYQIDYDSGNFSQALQWSARYLERFGQGTDARSMRELRGELLYLLRHYEEAIEYFEEMAGQEGEKRLSAQFKLADIYRNLDRRTDEARVLDSIISASPGQRSPIMEQALFLRATQLKESGELQRAMTLYREFLESYPDSHHTDWAMYHLAQITMEVSSHQEALTLVHDILSRSTDTILLSAATSLANEIDLDRDIQDFHLRRTRFSEGAP